jgi:nitric oxide reductase NorE protein
MRRTPAVTREATLPMNAPGMSVSRNAAGEVKEHLPGEHDVWVFVLGELVVFAAYFGAYMVDRGRNHELFLQSQQLLSQGLGVMNTLALLTSSLFVALSIQAARTADVRGASRWLALGGACGAAFALIKCFEWYSKLRDGLTISTNAFFMHYYMMTSVHLFHLLLGLVILGILWRELHRANGPRARVMESGACYWHTIDLLWVVIFALLYLMR